jgi:exopolysaccharide biosynthesis polyprenyl glycosylphosphotransferase
MIPRRIFWFLDLIVITIAFLSAYLIVPFIHSLLMADRPELNSWVTVLDIPQVLSGWLPPIMDFAWVFMVVTPTALVLLGVLGAHKQLLEVSRARILGAGIISPVAGLALVTMAMFTLKSPGWSRLFIFLFTFLNACGLCLYRLVLRQYYSYRREAGVYAKNIILIGLPDSVVWMTKYFEKNFSETEYRLLGYLAVNQGPDIEETSVAGKDQKDFVTLDLLGRVEGLGDMLIHRPIHEVIAVLPCIGNGWVNEVIDACDYFGVTLRIVPETLLTGERTGLKILYPSESLYLPAVVLVPPQWDSEFLFIKRVFDVIISAALLIVLSPLFLLIALAIKITSPNLPIFYHWHVVAHKGVEFIGYKFTTMAFDADDRRKELESQNEMNGPVFKIRNDPRVTPLGRFLRKYSLNELPQLWSVLKGDMSLVGPRPAFRHELERYEFWQKRRLSIKPGITCLWQVSGRNKINDFNEWVRLDLEYIDKWSLWLDFKILLRTVWVVIRGTGC